MARVVFNKLNRGKDLVKVLADATPAVYTDVSLPVQSSADTLDANRQIITDVTDADCISAEITNMFNVDGGVGKMLYCNPGYGSTMIDYLNDTDKSVWVESDIFSAMRTDMEMFTRVQFLTSNLSYAAAALTDATEITLELTYIASDISNATLSWSGIIYQETQTS